MSVVWSDETQISLLSNSDQHHVWRKISKTLKNSITTVNHGSRSIVQFCWEREWHPSQNTGLRGMQLCRNTEAKFQKFNLVTNAPSNRQTI